MAEEQEEEHKNKRIRLQEGARGQKNENILPMTKNNLMQTWSFFNCCSFSLATFGSPDFLAQTP